jgi:pimeloyl-ACP methyl ester carboxylesterase
VIHEFGFEEVPPNQVTARLVDLDQRLTPERGLRRFDGTKLVSIARPAATPRALLLVHGTFSKGDMYLTELGATPEGKQFLARALAHYDQVLCFDHPTLSVSPILNALDLERALAGYAGTLDIVCHSRGGLVAAWWMRMAPRKVGRVVFVGAPLEGTSLAAPARLREALDGLANIASLVQHVATAAGVFVPPAAPLLAVGAGLMKILGGVLSIGAGTPLADAGVALVPGLAAQSRVANNLELSRLHQGPWPSAPAVSAVMSNFEVGDPDAAWWEFWRRWRKPLTAIGDSAADAVFQGDNDLVVDTASMKLLCGVPFPAEELLDFGTNDAVHHTNYFAQVGTVRFLRRTLAIP